VGDDPILDLFHGEMLMSKITVIEKTDAIIG